MSFQLGRLTHPRLHSYYQSDGTYQGGVSDFKEGWATVAKACREIAPAVKMWYTPNVASLSQCEHLS